MKNSRKNYEKFEDLFKDLNEITDIDEDFFTKSLKNMENKEAIKNGIKISN